jgi:hypothetical protein
VIVVIVYLCPCSASQLNACGCLLKRTSVYCPSFKPIQKLDAFHDEISVGLLDFPTQHHFIQDGKGLVKLYARMTLESVETEAR